MTSIEREYGIAYWSSPGWRAAAVAWLDEQLGAAGRKRTGPVGQPHLAPWATALTAATSGGAVWLKAAGPGTSFEIGLYELLSTAAPDDVLTPIALDVARGWVLLPDGGTPLAERYSGSELVEAFAGALRRYGLLQRAVAPHAERLLDLGVHDMRPAAMPQRFEQALEAVREFVRTTAGAENRRAYERVAGMGETVAAWCERLADGPGAPSLDHNDLHPRNVLIGGDGADRVRFFDWGDSVVAHPFSSMLTPLQSRVLACAADDPRLTQLRDAYLEAFSDLAEHAELVETLELACRVGKIARALTWDRVLRALDPADVAAE